MDNSGFDFSDEKELNYGNNGQDVVVRKEDMTILNNPDCKHSRVKKDPTDTIGITTAWKCPDCHLGWFLPSHINNIT